MTDISKQTLEELNVADIDKSTGLKALNERHRFVMRLDLLGKSNREIARLTGYSPGRISQIKNTRVYKETKRAMRAELNETFIEQAAEETIKDPVRAELERAKVRAIKLNVELMENAQSETVKQRSIFDILDRAGYKPKDVVQQEQSLELDEATRDTIAKTLADLRKDKE